MIARDRAGEETAPLVQCVPNFSEGRDFVVLRRIADTIARFPVRLVDWSADIDHNRSVFTFVGYPEAVANAAVAAARQAMEDIDLSQHSGVHPRLGAMDVLPFVPLRNISLSDCANLARDTGLFLAEQLGIPIFLYDSASEVGRTLPDVRKGAFSQFKPDFGPLYPHPSAGATAIGARGPLIAFNINLLGGTLRLAKEIASLVRTVFSGRVRALGLGLPSRGIFQVSVNVIRPDQVTLAEIIDFVAARAEVLETELIGAMPGYAAFGSLKSTLKLKDLRPEQVLLETWPRSPEQAEPNGEASGAVGVQ